MGRRWGQDAGRDDTSRAAAADGHAGDATRDAYQRAFRAHTSAAWSTIESGHDDLLRLLIGTIPAETGVPVIFGVSVLFAGHPKGDDAGRALLATALADLSPERARTLLATLADGWHNAERQAFDRRALHLREALQQALRRLGAVEMPQQERDTLRFIADLVDQSAPDHA